jgi:hypothetical protein
MSHCTSGQGGCDNPRPGFVMICTGINTPNAPHSSPVSCVELSFFWLRWGSYRPCRGVAVSLFSWQVNLGSRPDGFGALLFLAPPHAVCMTLGKSLHL